MKPIVLRRYRVFFVFAMLILLPLSGVLWAMTESMMFLALAILLSCMSVIAVFAEESVSAAIDEEVDRLQTRVENQTEKIKDLDEALREDDRILKMLEEQNSRVSAELIAKSVQSEAA